MNTKTLLGALIAGVVSFLLGWLIFGILLMDYYTANKVQYPGLLKDPMEIWPIAVADLAWGLLVSWIFSMANIKTVAKGVTVGFLIGFLMVLGFDLFVYAELNLYSTRLLGLDVIMNGIMGAASGAVLGWWYGRPA